MTEPQFNKIIEHADSLRSGLAKLSLKALGDYAQVYDLSDKEVKEAQKLLLRKVADSSDFIRSSAVDSLRTLTLRFKVASVTSFLALLKAGFLATSISQS